MQADLVKRAHGIHSESLDWIASQKYLNRKYIALMLTVLLSKIARWYSMKCNAH